MFTSPKAIETLRHADFVPGLDETILRRWSPRALANRPIRASDLTKLFDAIRWPASSYNEQRWKLLVDRKGDPASKLTFPSGCSFKSATSRLLLNFNGSGTRCESISSGMLGEVPKLQRSCQLESGRL